MREINRIVIHCSDSDWGTEEEIDKWHKARGWDGNGYHYVITNGHVSSCVKYNKKFDGVIQAGRELRKIGAHVKGHNKDSIGICLIGKHHFTGKQMYEALPKLINMLLVSYSLTTDDVFAHNQFDPDKGCPNFNINWLRDTIKGNYNYVLPS